MVFVYEPDTIAFLDLFIAIGFDIYMMVNGLLGGGEIVASALELLVLAFYTLGFLISFIDYQKAKKKGSL